MQYNSMKNKSEFEVQQDKDQSINLFVLLSQICLYIYNTKLYLLDNQMVSEGTVAFNRFSS